MRSSLRGILVALETGMGSALQELGLTLSLEHSEQYIYVVFRYMNSTITSGYLYESSIKLAHCSITIPSITKLLNKLLKLPHVDLSSRNYHLNSLSPSLRLSNCLSPTIFLPLKTVQLSNYIYVYLQFPQVYPTSCFQLRFLL
jgi:hypothetical protein